MRIVLVEHLADIKYSSSEKSSMVHHVYKSDYSVDETLKLSRYMISMRILEADESFRVIK